MTEKNGPNVQMDSSGNIAGLDEALAAARDSGFQAGRTEGYAAGRADAAAILASDEAEGRSRLANKLAADASMSPDKAKEWLTEANKEAKEPSYAERLASSKPEDPGPNPDNNPHTDKQQARRSSLKQTAALVSGRKA